MNCSICHRWQNGKKLPFLCAACARNQLYEVRLDNVRGIMANEELETAVNAILETDDLARVTRVQIENWRSEQAAAIDRTSEIIARAEQLQVELEAAKKEVAAKKDKMARRVSDLASVSQGLESRSSRQLGDIEDSIQRTKMVWSHMANQTAATRAFLCEESARLYGLRQVKKGSSRCYEIAGMVIMEPHDMNKVAPEVLSTCLAHVAHMVMLASKYLAVRLPAEITLPHRDYPRPTIFNTAASYRHGEIPPPRSVVPPHPSARTRSGANESEQQQAPHPRPLFIDKLLSVLAKEDAAAYSSFLEGVALLAYDIAWLCCSQGVSLGGEKHGYEDVCNMGQNLWRLLIGDQLHRKSHEPTFPIPLPGAAQATSTNKARHSSDLVKTKGLIGHWSHGTTYSFLGSADGTEMVRNFKLPSPTKIHDMIKTRLANDAMLEWEKIDCDEVAAEVEGETSGSKRSQKGAATAGGAAGLNGWTRLRSR